MKKVLRFSAALLMLTSGVWHTVLFIKNPESVPLMVFGILFALIGIMLFMPGKIGLYLGLLPITGICTALIAVGLRNFDFSISVLVLIDIIVISICLYLILSKTEAVQTVQ